MIIIYLISIYVFRNHKLWHWKFSWTVADHQQMCHESQASLHPGQVGNDKKIWKIESQIRIVFHLSHVDEERESLSIEWVEEVIIVVVSMLKQHLWQDYQLVSLTVDSTLVVCSECQDWDEISNQVIHQVRSSWNMIIIEKWGRGETIIF